MQRFVGTIVGESGELVFADATLTVGKKKQVERREGPGAFTLALADGRTIEVRGVVSAERRGRLELEGQYGELVSHPITRLFDAKAPGDHVRAHVRGFGLFGGDAITVLGEVIEERLVRGEVEDTGGLRTAPPREPSVIRATKIFIGDATDGDRDPSAPTSSPRAPRAPSVRPRRPLETSSLVALGLGAPLAMLGLALSWLMPLVPLRAWLTPLVAVGVALALVGLQRVTRGRWHASYVTVVGGRRLTTSAPIKGYDADPYVVVFGHLTWVWLCAIEPSPSAVTVCLSACAVLPAIHLVLRFLQERPFRRFASLVLGTPTRGDPGGGRMLLAEGKVTSTGTVIRRRVEFIPKTETRHSTDQSGHTHESTTTVLRDREHTSAQPFALALDAGGLTIEVDPSEAHVALARRRWEPHASIAVYEETLAEGQRCCVAARFEKTDDGALSARAGGEESFFVWAGSRSELARALLFSRLGLALGALLVALPIALGLYAFPFGARFHATATVSSSSGVVAVGDTCSLRVLAHHYGATPRCSVRLRCDDGVLGQSLYGGFGMGQMDCTFAESPLDPTAVGGDASVDDGDPAIAFSLSDRTLTWSDASGQSFSASLDPPSPSVWW